MDLVMANVQGGSSAVMRDYRKGNWTLQETMVLIEAKKMDDERRMKRQGDGSGERSGKPAELRWKWVEDYCWRNSCLRSQNQCNDKWDNLMRDFKRVREYEKRLAAEHRDSKSYWKLEKNERKGNNLPSNMLPQIYDALIDVVERKGLKGTAASSSVPYLGTSSSSPQVPVLPLPPPPPPPGPPLTHTHPHPTLPFSQQLPTVDSDTSHEHSDSPAKRRRRRGGEGSSEMSNEVGTAISRSASLIAEAMHACEEREERRHRELLSMHERRLQIEESKAEITRQGIHGLVDAVNKLATSILSLASHNRNQSAP